LEEHPVEATAASAPTAEINSQSAAQDFEVSPSSRPENADSMSDADFEARVAAAMSAYSSSEDSAPAVESQPPIAPERSGSLASTDVYAMHEAEAEADHDSSAGIPAFEYQPPVRPEAVAEPVQFAEPVPAEEKPASESGASGGTELTAAAESSDDHHSIAQAIHRVMERLKPELLEEIMRELKSKK
jgi:hypothetical protein